MEQRTSEWHLARKGKFTASEIHKLLTSSKKKDEVFGDTALTYIKTKVDETIMSDTAFINFRDAYDFSSKEMRWGEDFEEEARKVYEQKTGILVDTCGFYQYTERSGGSPDGLIISENGIIEIKCPFTGKNHVDFLMMNDQNDLKSVSKEYYTQMQANMIFTGAMFCDFISYNPRCSELLKMKILRVYPDEPFQEEIKTRIALAEQRLEQMLSAIIQQATHMKLKAA